MKEVMNYREFCKNNGLSELSQQARTSYQSYVDKSRIENGPDIEAARERAKEVLSESSKKKQ